MRELGGLRSQIDANVLGFVRCLRAAEFNVTTEHAGLIGRALSELSRPDLPLSRNACRAICCQRRRDWDRFDALFDAFWFPQGPDSEAGTDTVPEHTRGGTEIRPGLGGSADALGGPGFDEAIGGTGAGRHETIAKADFRFLNNRDAMRRVEQLAEGLAAKLRPRLSRRRKLSKRAGQLAIAPTLRASVRTGGLPLVPWFARRRVEPPRLVVLHDVSDSMTFNNPLLFRFSRGLVKRFDTAEVFVFHTRLFRVTPILRESSIARMRELLERNNRLWLGGTCIADSLAAFRERFSRRVVRADSLVIVISDGFDSNAPERLAAELEELKRRCRRLIWMNPMLEREGFNPEKESVWNIRRNVDRLMPAHSLDSLRRTVEAIRG